MYAHEDGGGLGSKAICDVEDEPEALSVTSAEPSDPPVMRPCCTLWRRRAPSCDPGDAWAASSGCDIAVRSAEEVARRQQAELVEGAASGPQSPTIVRGASWARRRPSLPPLTRSCLGSAYGRLQRPRAKSMVAIVTMHSPNISELHSAYSTSSSLTSLFELPSAPSPRSR